MSDARNFIRSLVEDGALGERIVAGRSGTESSPPFGFHDIEAICRFALPKQPLSIRLSFFGRNVDRAVYRDEQGFYDFEKIETLHRGGATVIANQIHDFSGGLHALKLDLERALHCYVNVNCYATPMKAQGLARHVDSHDVVILQMQGRKRWQLFDRAPRAGNHYTMDGFEQASPPEERTLSPGDLLYIPAGFVHAAQSDVGATSLHLTIGFSPPTWKTMLDAWVSTAAKDDPTLGREIPPAMLRADAPPAPFEALARAALDRVAAAPLGDAHSRLTAYESPGSRGVTNATCPGVAFETLAADTSLSKAPGTSAELFAGALRIRAASGRRLELRRECANAWADIDRRTVFRPKDVAGRLPEGAETLFCYYLLNNGLLTRS